MDTTPDTPDDSSTGAMRTTVQAGSLTLTVWPDEPVGGHQRYAYRIHDTTTGQTVEGRDLFTGADAPVGPGRAIRDLAGFLSASGEAWQYALDNPGVTPENAALFPEPIAEAAQANLDALTLLSEYGPQPEQSQGQGGPVRRWVSIVFLQGAEADEVLDLLDRDGAAAAIEHLAGYDYGAETTQAALENGYVYDTPPTGMLDRTATSTIGRNVYTLTYNPFLGHVSLLRAYDRPPDPALLDTPEPAPSTPAMRPPKRQAHAGAGTDWFSRPPTSPTHDRGLTL